MRGDHRRNVGEAGFSLLEALAAVIVLGVAWTIIQGLLETGVLIHERERLAWTARSAGNTLRELAIAGALTGEGGTFTSGSTEWHWHIEHPRSGEGNGQSGSNSLYVRQADNASALAAYRADFPVRD